MEFPRTRKPMRAIELVPLIDVAMFLLIFFMVAGTVEKFALIPIAPPKAQSGKLLDEGHMVILMGTREELVLDDDLIPLDQLEARVREQLKANPNKVITLKADAGIPASRMIQVMDRIKLAGGRNLSLATQSERKPHAP